MAILKGTEGQNPTVGAKVNGKTRSRAFTNVGTPAAPDTGLLNRRVSVVEPSGGPWANVVVTSQPAHGRATARGDGKVTVDLFDYTGTDTISFNVDSDNGGAVTSETLSFDVIDSRQDKGFGKGRHPLLETDADNQIIAEPGRNHRKLYVSSSSLLDKAEIERRENINNASGNVLKTLTNTHSAPDLGELYGSTPDLALDPDRGRQLWNQLDADGTDGYHSVHILFERGGDYTEFGACSLANGRGESILHPVLIGAYGDTAQPEPILQSVKLWPSNACNVVLQNLEVEDMRLRSNNFVTLDNVTSDVDLDFQSNWGKLVDGTILRRSIIKFSSKGQEYCDERIALGNTVWPEHHSRQSGQFISGFEDFLLENLFFHHNGWADGYDYFISLNNANQPPSQYSHNHYTSAGGTQDEAIDGEVSNANDMTYRNSLSTEGSLTGFQGRTGFVGYNLFFAGNNVAVTMGGGPKDTINDRNAGNFSYLKDSVVTWAGQRETDPWNMATANGIKYGSKNTVTYNNIVIHASHGNDGVIAHGTATKGVAIGSDGVTASSLYDDTLVYDWLDSANANLGALNTADLDALTIEDYTDTADATTGSTRYDFITRLLADPAPWSTELDAVLDYFRAGTNRTLPTRGTARTSVFQPHDTIPSQGRRGDDRLNWDDEIVPGHVVGDSIDCNGHIVTWFDNPANRLAGLSVNDGEWHQYGGKVDLSGSITTGGTMRLKRAAQLFCGTMNVATGVLDIGIDSGRIANTGTWQGDFDLSVSGDAEALLGIDTATTTIANGRTLEVVGGRCFCGFDGEQDGTATLNFAAGGTLAFKTMLRLPYTGAGDNSFVVGSTVTGGTSGFTGVIDRIVLGNTTATGWLWIDAFTGTPTLGENLVAVATNKSNPIASGTVAQAGTPEFTIGAITEFRSGMFGAVDPAVNSVVDLTNATITVDSTGLAAGTYDLIDVDSLTQGGATLPAGVTVSGNKLVLTVA